MKLFAAIISLSTISPIQSSVTLFGACYNERTDTHVCHFNSTQCRPASDYVPETTDYRGRVVPAKPAEPDEIWWTPNEVIDEGYICLCDEEIETFAAGACYDSVTHDVSCHFDRSECPPDVDGNPTYWLGNRYTSKVTIDHNGDGAQCTCKVNFDAGEDSATYGVCWDEESVLFHCALAEHTCESSETYYPNHVLKALGGSLTCECHQVKVGGCHREGNKKIQCAVDSDSCDEDYDFISARQLTKDFPDVDCRLCPAPGSPAAED